MLAKVLRVSHERKKKRKERRRRLSGRPPAFLQITTIGPLSARINDQASFHEEMEGFAPRVLTWREAYNSGRPGLKTISASSFEKEIPLLAAGCLGNRARDLAEKCRSICVPVRGGIDGVSINRSTSSMNIIEDVKGVESVEAGRRPRFRSPSAKRDKTVSCCYGCQSVTGMKFCT